MCSEFGFQEEERWAEPLVQASVLGVVAILSVFV